MQRVVITGIGAVSPIGNNINEVWESIEANRHGIGEITKFDASDLEVSLVGEVKDFDPSDVLSRRDARRQALFSQYAVVAAQEALDMSGYDISSNPHRVGVYVGNGIGGIPEIESTTIRMHEKGARRVPPLFIPANISNMAAGNVSMHTGARGPSMVFMTACAAGTSAVGEAFLAVRDGRIDACFAGGTEAAVTKLSLAGFESLTAATTNPDPDTASRPFDKNRDGFVYSEGGAMLFIESLESAQKRGAKIYAEIVGYGANSDAYHLTQPRPDGEGAAFAMQAAMDMAGIEASDVDYINAHGTSTPVNDVAETKAIKTALGEHANNVAVSSTKGHTGHLLGAAGALEAVICTLAIHNGFIPATLGLREQDPECDLDYVPLEGRKSDIRYALSNSFGFGGHNAVLAFKRWED